MPTTSKTTKTTKKSTAAAASVKTSVAKKAMVDKTVTTETAAKSVKKSAVKKADTVEANLTIDVMDVTGKKAGTVTLPKEIFGAKVNPTLMAQAVRVYLANQRQGTARTQTRGDVHASTRKIYRQKGTGRARHGALSAPLFVGGGTTFGPKPRDFSLALPKKMRRAALFSALTQKLSEKQIAVVDFGESNGKTKVVFGALKVLNMLDKKGKGHKILFVSDNTETVKRAVANIAGLDLVNVNTLTTYEVLNHKHLLFVKGAVENIEQVYGGK